MKSECVVVGHRGFKGKHTENTIHGFERCFDTGASSIETDVWITKDDVLLISHDVNTSRVFCDENGNETNYNILESNYDQLKPLRTIGSGESLMTFKHMLKWFLDYVKESSDRIRHKIMLDLKNANPPKLLKLLFEDMIAVHADVSWWFPRIQIGVWNLRFLKYLNQEELFQNLFKDLQPYQGFAFFDIYHISLSWQDSMMYLAYNEYLSKLDKDRVKFRLSGVSIIHVSTWSKDFIKKFMPAAKAQNLSLYTWTVNRESQLRYFCALVKTWNLPEYGVITDLPDLMVDSSSSELWFNGEKPELISGTFGSSVSGSAGELGLVVPSSFLFFAWLIRVSTFFMKPPQSSENASFDSYVIPNETLSVKPKLVNRIFSLFQKWGFV